jgi:hypothetical protein
MEVVMGKEIVAVERQNMSDLLEVGEQLTVAGGWQEEKDTEQEQEQGQGQVQEQVWEQDRGVSQASTVEEWRIVVGDQPEENGIVP